MYYSLVTSVIMVLLTFHGKDENETQTKMPIISNPLIRNDVLNKQYESKLLSTNLQCMRQNGTLVTVVKSKIDNFQSRLAIR